MKNDSDGNGAEILSPSEDEKTASDSRFVDDACETRVTQTASAPEEDSPASPTEKNKANPFAIAGLVLAFLFAPAGLILGAIGLVKSQNTAGTGKAMSIAALVISSSIIILAIIYVFVVCFVLTEALRALIEAMSNAAQDSESLFAPFV